MKEIKNPINEFAIILLRNALGPQEKKALRHLFNNALTPLFLVLEDERQRALLRRVEELVRRLSV